MEQDIKDSFKDINEKFQKLDERFGDLLVVLSKKRIVEDMSGHDGNREIVDLRIRVAMLELKVRAMHTT